MAKIYETHRDFERDKLDQQAKNMEITSHKQNTTGLAFFAMGLLTDTWNLAKKTPNKALSMVSGALSVIGIIEWVRSWRSGNKAHDLKLERERLGPAQVVYPPEDVAAAAMAAPAAAPCNAIVRALQGKSLMQHAEKTECQNTPVL